MGGCQGGKFCGIVAERGAVQQEQSGRWALNGSEESTNGDHHAVCDSSLAKPALTHLPHHLAYPAIQYSFNP